MLVVPVTKFVDLVSEFAFQSLCLFAATGFGVLLNFPSHGDDVSLEIFSLCGKTFTILSIVSRPCFALTVTRSCFSTFPFGVSTFSAISFFIQVGATRLLSTAFFLCEVGGEECHEFGVRLSLLCGFLSVV